MNSWGYKEGIKTAAGLAAIVVTATAVAVTGPLTDCSGSCWPPCLRCHD